MRNQEKTMDKSICVKLNNELIQKLDSAAKATGKTRSAVAREFISNGEVKAYYGSDKIINEMCKIEGRMNDYCLHTIEEIENVRREFAIAKSIIQALNEGILQEAPFTICLDAERKIDKLEQNLRRTHKNLDTELNNCVYIQSNSKQ